MCSHPSGISVTLAWTTARRRKQGARIAMADRPAFVSCQTFIGVQFGGEGRGDVGEPPNIQSELRF
jgi:hypothetical protein